MKTRVYLTVDAEASMGGAWSNPQLRPVGAERRVFCRTGGQDYGIGWQCQRLRERGLKATFFCEVLSSLVLGEDDTRSYLEFLFEEEQDVQLHVHPNFYFYAEKLWADANHADYAVPAQPDNLGAMSTEDQAKILGLAVDIYKYLTGRDPTAFRAGGYAADERTLSILARQGLRIDSSWNPVYHRRGSFATERPPVNRPFLLNGVLELPVTLVADPLPLPGKARGLRPLEVCALSAAEMRTALNQLHDNGVSDVVIVHHSFACVKATDVQYRQIKPDRMVMRRFTSLLDFLAENSGRFEVMTMGAMTGLTEPTSARREFVPVLGYLPPLWRTVQQTINRFYVV